MQLLFFCSRLAALKDEFAAALSDADQVVVTAVHASKSIVFVVYRC
jgi:UDP-N-acetylmuramate-alanine ligase